MHFLAEHLRWGVSDFDKITWKMRKEMIQFHVDVLEARKRANGK